MQPFNALMPGEHDWMKGKPMPGQAPQPSVQPKRNPVMNALSTVFEYGAPEAYEAGRQKKITRELGNRLAGGDVAGAGQYALQQGNLDQGMQLQGMATEQDAARRKQEAQGVVTLFSQGPQFVNQFAMEDPAGFEQQTGMTAEEYLQAAGRFGDGGQQFAQFAMQKAQAELGQAEKPEANKFGFVNIPGVGIVKTDPRSGEAGVAFELPEGAQDAAGADNVQSVQVLDNGELAIITRSGELRPTGKFARNPYQITNIGEVPYAVDRITGGASAISTPEAVGTSKATVGTVVANEEDRRKAEKDLPNVVSKANSSIGTLTALRDHPALKFRYGLASVGGARPVIPGTPEAEVQALINQAGGQAFLQAFESLKGAGQITEIEGNKATAAITRLGNQNLSPEDAATAINELIQIAENGKKRAEAQAGGAYAAPGASGQRLKYNPATGEFE